MCLKCGKKGVSVIAGVASNLGWLAAVGFILGFVVGLLQRLVG